MFTAITTHEKFERPGGVELKPVLSMVEDGMLCHIVVDDGCYVAYLEIEDTGYVPVTYIFSELHDALCSLPNPEEHANSGPRAPTHNIKAGETL